MSDPYNPAVSLAEITGEWRVVAARRPARAKPSDRPDVGTDTWVWNLPPADVRRLTFDLAPVGEITTAQARGPDGVLLLLARRITNENRDLFAEWPRRAALGRNPLNRRHHGT